jgi:plastocyanin
MSGARITSAFAMLLAAASVASFPGIAYAQGNAPAGSQRVGRATIQGVITGKSDAARRIASRYAGAATPSTEQKLPVLVYLRGAGLPTIQPSVHAPEMAQHDTAFAPAYLAVPVGTTVLFRNEDPFYHNVFSYSKAKRFDLGRFPKPEAKGVTFNKEGTVDISCEIHRSMHGVVLVTDNAYHTEAAADGSYALRDVPAGKYELVVWNAGKGEKVLPVTVPASGVVTLNAKF